MIIKSISLKNFKSFGNNKQKVSFNTNSGELILLSGKNGAGKSSFQQSIDFCIFGIVRGKNGKRVPQSILPNRINKNLETEVEFINNLSNDIKIQRNLEPNLAKIFINDSDETKKFKTYKKSERDAIFGFDYETYKSFISLSVSDFANFIDLSPDDKRNIINRLFNLQDLDSYLTLTNGLIKVAKEEMLKYETIVETNKQTINTLNQNIITIKRSGVLDKEKEAEKLEKEKLSKKEPYLKYKKNIQTFDSKLIGLEKQRQDFDNQKNIITNDIFEIKIEIRNLDDKLKVYESGICPVCSTDLKDEKHLHDLSDINSKHDDLNQKLAALEKNKNEIILKLTQISNQKESILKQKNATNLQLNTLVYDLKILTSKIGNLKEDNNDISVDELTKNIEELKKKNIVNEKKIGDLITDITIYGELKDVFSNKGVRKNIIKSNKSKQRKLKRWTHQCKYKVAINGTQTTQTVE